MARSAGFVVVAILAACSSPARQVANDGGFDGGIDAGSDGSVLEHHGSGTRAGLYVDPLFTKANAAKLQPSPGFSAEIVGPVFSQPLFLTHGVGDAGTLYVTTEQDTVDALDATTGDSLWQTSVGTPVPNSTFAPCGTIDPLGITGTPVIDPASRTLYLDAMTLQDAGPRHMIEALSVDDGSIKWQLDVQATVSGFDSLVQNQRGALTILDGNLYVPYGGLAGGCGNFHGWVVGVPLANPMGAAGWHTAGIGAGIWGPSGVASDGTSVFVSTAENELPSGVWAQDNGEAILRIGAGPAFSGQPADFFAPKDWYSLELGESQLGASGVVLLDQSGSTPSHLAFAIGKTSNAYLVDRDSLGGETDGVDFLPALTTDWVEGSLAAYTTSLGSYVAMATSSVGCPPEADFSVVKIVPGTPPTLAAGWCAVQGGAGSPIATESSVAQDVVVWALGTSSYFGNGSQALTAFDGDTGQVLARSAAMGPAGDLSHWISPIVAAGRLYVAGNSQVYAFSLDGPEAPAPDAGLPATVGDAGPPASCLTTVAVDQPDPCAPYGLACSSSQQSQLGQCVAPSVNQACLPAAGCASPLTCVPHGDGFACEPPCQTSADCTDPLRSCQMLDGGSTSVCLPAPCSQYYAACGEGGTCVPLLDKGGAPLGDCLTAGTATTSCTGTRANGDVSGLCAAGQFCENQCVPICDLLQSWGIGDGGPACTGTEVCLPIGAGFGVCLEPCTITCPTGFSCDEVSGALSVCIPD